MGIPLLEKIRVGEVYIRGYSQIKHALAGGHSGQRYKLGVNPPAYAVQNCLLLPLGSVGASRFQRVKVDQRVVV
jgi:hypothetical protein